MNKPELLAPAGNLEKLKAAVDYGADAVYLGGSKLNLRANADNFNDEDLKAGIVYAHLKGKKVYVTINIFPHNHDLIGLEDYLVKLKNIGADAIIVSDPGVISAAKETVPELEIHLSTQANCTNYKSALFWNSIGVKRLVMARELSLNDYKTLRDKLPSTCEVEAFVHGSMCISYSGRCLLSNYMTGRDANRGECAQPCRYKYHLVEEKRPGEFFNITEDGNGTYIMNSKDLCMIEYIPELIESGINSLKIEGRMKSAFYVASVVKAYRAAIDKYAEDPRNYFFNPKWMEYLVKPSHRPFTTGFYFGEEIKQHYKSSSYIRSYDIVGVVKSYHKDSQTAVIEQRNKVLSGDIVEIMTPKGDNKTIELLHMRNAEGVAIGSAPSAQMIFTIQCSEVLREGDMLIKSRRANSTNG
ncbi:MAG TPA: peptidase U32 [Ruminococcaceae bacterium]|jgi:putative protease|nr:peptidase U32 [Oscillospiraceae bacterium]